MGLEGVFRKGNSMPRGQRPFFQYLQIIPHKVVEAIWYIKMDKKHLQEAKDLTT